MLRPNPRNPLLVVDWNILQSVGRSRFEHGQLMVPANCDFLLPDEVVQEVFGKPDGEQGAAIQHFRTLVAACRAYSARIWLSRPADCFTLYSRPLKTAQLIGQAVRNLDLNRTDSELAAMLTAGRSSDQHRRFQECRNWFIEWVSEYREWFQRTRPNDASMTHDKQKCAQLVQEPSLLRGAVQPDDMARLSLTDAQIACYPDALPCCRWMRLACWYMLRHANRPAGQKANGIASNDFADATYAFLSSYTGHLLTRDSGCQEAARALRPDVQIWEWDQETQRITRLTGTPA